ncbi:DNA methyltransferase [Vibrio parahaemolyticus]|uniref:DNA methyltransferase n=1 Tax=Vibrio parahaemolyticus TaxID=670 RepID=UPI00236003A8|nr:DNA methyltransferase [Vibrio parahaemolyticus]
MPAVKQLNIVDIENGLERLANENSSPEEFGKELVRMFGSTTTLKRLGATKANTSCFENGILWREKLHYVPCNRSEIGATLEAAKNSDQTRKAKVRLIIVNDGVNILVYDRKYDELTESLLKQIKNEPQLFLPLAGQEGFRREQESEVDIKATGKLAKLYDALIEQNPDWLEGDKRHALNHFMTQIIFCLFAEDTGIFSKYVFTKTLKNRSGSNGEKASDVISDIFNILDVDYVFRTQTAGWLKEFPYVNGGLFSGNTLIPEFTPKAYRYLLEASSLDWKHINPDILGSSIQAIVDPTMRGNLGMHYTSVPNILKTLDPLFLDELRDEFFKSRHTKKSINQFLERLSKIVVFDPACGSGNFLVIAYRELRKLELQALDALRDLQGGASMAFGFSSVISLSNFYGIEYADFAAETAKLALWIAEYQQNTRFKAAFGADIPALPLRSSVNVVCGNALRISWDDLLDDKPQGELIICSNPPFLGKNKQERHHKEDMDHVFGGKVKGYRSLDYVSCWYLRAVELATVRDFKLALVSTNSLCQGQSVINLWPYILGNGLEISFCVTPFHWKNNAADNAGVICVIVGLQKKSNRQKCIIDQSSKKSASNINPYLLDAPSVIPVNQKKPISNLKSMRFGNMPYDSGALILSELEKEQFIEEDSRTKKFIRLLLGSKEFINGLRRFCLWIKDEDLEEACSIPLIRERIEQCRVNRSQSKDAAGKKLADTPYKFREAYESLEQTIIVPSVSSINRDYLPVGVLDKDVVVSNLAFAIYDGDLSDMAIICSRIHLLWIRTVCGKLKNDYRYSNQLGWHTFPLPTLNSNQVDLLKESARNIILIRERHYPKSIAELYARENMPEDLKQAHVDNDKLLESFYRDKPFKNDEERLAHLFERYVDMTKGF